IAPCATQLSFFFSCFSPQPISTLFPYTTLFRSRSSAPLTIAAPRGCSLPRSSAAAKRTNSVSPVPPSGVMLTSFGFPSVSVPVRSEEHTSELQSRGHLVCRLLLAKKNQERSFRP